MNSLVPASQPATICSECERVDNMTENEARVVAFAKSLGLTDSEITACCNQTSQITKTILAFSVQMQAFGDVRDARVAARLLAFSAFSTVDGVVEKATSNVPSSNQVIHRITIP